MAKPAARIGALQVILGLAGLVMVGRAFQLQVGQHEAWRERATARDNRERVVPARRGALLDRDGMPLAVTLEAYHLLVAPDQVTQPDSLRRLLREALGIPARRVRQQLARRYPYFDGPFTAAEVQRIRRLDGVHLRALPRRDYPMGAVALALLGRTNDDGRGIEGLEKAFDSLLTGRPGRERYLRDADGLPVFLPDGMLLEPVPGRDVVLTIDHELQGIAEDALRHAVVTQQARGGDVIFLDLRSGEVLAMASLRSDGGGPPRPTSSAIVEPMEPGSTAKIFTAAAVLMAGDTTPVLGEGGHWEMPITSDGRTRSIDDTHRESGFLSLGRTIAVSSNIAISKFAQTIQDNAQYRVLRDFGFGTPTATGFPGESRGLLRQPHQNPNAISTAASWGQGYEFMASSLQLAAAYGAIANNGTYVAPTLLRGVREPDGGGTAWHHAPDTLRRVVSAAVADRLMQYLQLVTDSGGTGTRAQLDLMDVIGKTGTAKLLAAGTTEYAREYRASFAGIFPADAPRFVVYVMIDRPGGDEIYGGEVAAPVVRTMIQQALALDASPFAQEVAPVLAARPRRSPPVVAAGPMPTARLAFPLAGPGVGERAPVDVPDVRGMTVRDGVYALHRRGLHVRLEGTGRIGRLTPAPGDSVAVGSTVTVHATSER
jgi:cell division protein FtsI (penicillin-binding protein 3)